MQSPSRTFPRATSTSARVFKPQTRNMSLLYYPSHHQHFHAPVRRAPVGFGCEFGLSPFSNSFFSHPLAVAHQFQLLDDTLSELSKLSAQTSSFAPKFDLKETEDAYQLEGKLPGVEEEDVTVEFLDDKTLRTKGRTETVKEEGRKPQQLEGQSQQKAVEQPQEQPSETPQPQPSRQATVEDETTESAEASDAVPAAETQAETSTEAATPAAESEAPATETTSPTQTQEIAKSEEPVQKQPTYWYSERSVGSFQRTFNFAAADVDHDAVKASLKGGVLSITIPKKVHQPKPEQTSRKVEISSDA